MDNREIAYQLTNAIVTKPVPMDVDSTGLFDPQRLGERVGQLYLKILEKIREGDQGAAGR